MEDLKISPWQNQQSKTLTNFYNVKQKSLPKLQDCSSLKNRFIHTQSNDQAEVLHKKRIFNLQIYRKKGQSSSTHQNFYQRKGSGNLSKLQIKLVPYPIQQKSKQRQTGIRYSEKWEGKQKIMNQSFEVIQTIFNQQLKKMKVLKERHFIKNGQHNENFARNNFYIKNRNRLNESLNELRTTQAQNMYMDDQKNFYKNKYRGVQSKFIIQRKQNIDQQKKEMKKRSLNRQRFHKYFISQNQALEQINKLNNNKQDGRIQRKSTLVKLEEKQYKNKQKQRKLSVQRLENINCFKDTTNIFTNLKKKNINLFNQLQKYNLFGLRSLGRKTKKR